MSALPFAFIRFRLFFFTRYYFYRIDMTPPQSDRYPLLCFGLLKFSMAGIFVGSFGLTLKRPRSAFRSGSTHNQTERRLTF